MEATQRGEGSPSLKRKLGSSGGHENLSPQTLARLAREVSHLASSPPADGIRYVPHDDDTVAEIHAEITGPGAVRATHAVARVTRQRSYTPRAVSGPPRPDDGVTIVRLLTLSVRAACPRLARAVQTTRRTKGGASLSNLCSAPTTLTRRLGAFF